MIEEKRIVQAIYGAITSFNQLLPKERRLVQSVDTVLLGQQGTLDSLDLVNLIVAVEQTIAEDFNVSVVLADERAMSQKDSPFRTVKSLSNYIFALLKDGPHVEQ